MSSLLSKTRTGVVHSYRELTSKFDLPLKRKIQIKSTGNKSHDLKTERLAY